MSDIIQAEADLVPIPANEAEPRGRRDATRGSLARVVLALALPIMGIMVLETGRSALELKFLGMLGPTAIDTAITINQTFHQLMMTFVIATAWGASALVAQRMGARQYVDAGQTMGQSLGICMSVGLFAAVIAIAGTDAVLGGIGMDTSVNVQGPGYLRLIGLVAVLPFVGFCLSTGLQATGDVMTPLLMVVLGAVTNIFCTWVFMFGIGPAPALGVLGIAFGQVGGSVVGLGIAVARIRRFHGDLGLRLRSLVEHDWGRVVRIARLSLPVWIQIMCRAIGIILIIRLAGSHGAMARAGYGVAMRVDMMLINVGMAFAGAAATVTGQNKGAERFRRAAAGPWVAWLYYTGILLLFTALFWWKAEAVLGLFTKDPEVIAVGASFLRITSAVYPFFSAAFVFSRAMQGAGDMWRPTIITAVTTFGVFIPLALWLPTVTDLGVSAVFLASALGIVVGGILQTVYFMRGAWRTVTA